MLYAGWLRMGFTHEAILLAARHALRQGKNKMEDVTRYLQSWAKQSLYTAEAINAYLSRRRQNIQRCYTLFEAAGISREPTNGDIRMMEQWRTQGYEPEMLAIAAESAKGAGNPMVYIGRVVENWAAKGISTPEAARAEHEKWVEGIRQRAESPAQNADAPRLSAAPPRRWARTASPREAIPTSSWMRCSIPIWTSSIRKEKNIWISFPARRFCASCWRKPAPTRKGRNRTPIACACAWPKRCRSMPT